jgi:solute carrier family 25 phosphate transporter 23/24/25/41
MGGAAPAATAPAAPAVLSSSSASSSWSSTLLSKDARYALSGGLAGATAKTCTAPLARLTILYQVEGATARAGGGAGAPTTALPRSVPAALASLVRREGVLALWRGNGVTILHRLPYSSINFWAYERSFAALDAAFPEKQQKGSSGGGGGSSQSSSSARAFGKRLAAGAVAGGVACAAAYPLDLVRTRLAAQVGGGGGGGGNSFAAATTAAATAATAAPPQPQQLYYRGVWGTLSTIARDEGLLGLYRGLGATLVQVVPTLGLNFGLYETSKAVVRQRREQRRQQRRAAAAASGEEEGGGESGDKNKAEALPPAATLACGCISGFVTATATFPLDVVRRRMQVAGRRAGEAGVAASPSSPSPPPARPSYAQVARDVVRQGGGLGGFYRGIGAEYCKVVPGVAIAFFVYESAKNALGVGGGAGGGGGQGGERR